MIKTGIAAGALMWLATTTGVGAEVTNYEEERCVVESNGIAYAIPIWDPACDANVIDYINDTGADVTLTEDTFVGKSSSAPVDDYAISHAQRTPTPSLADVAMEDIDPVYQILADAGYWDFGLGS